MSKVTWAVGLQEADRSDAEARGWRWVRGTCWAWGCGFIFRLIEAADGGVLRSSFNTSVTHWLLHFAQAAAEHVAIYCRGWLL